MYQVLCTGILGSCHIPPITLRIEVDLTGYLTSESVSTTVMDRYSCGGVFAYCGGWALLWWVILLDVVILFVYCGGY